MQEMKPKDEVEEQQLSVLQQQAAQWQQHRQQHQQPPQQQPQQQQWANNYQQPNNMPQNNMQQYTSQNNQQQWGQVGGKRQFLFNKLSTLHRIVTVIQFVFSVHFYLLTGLMHYHLAKPVRNQCKFCCVLLSFRRCYVP